jgi:hypothetical protein
MSNSNSSAAIEQNGLLPAGYCPQCGHETIVEDIKWFYGTVKTERCDELIELSSDKPLEACTWGNTAINTADNV